MGLSMSGFLPGEDADGLSRLDGKLIEDFEDAYAKGTEDRDPTLNVVVVGVLAPESVKHRRGKDAVVEVRFLAIEAVGGVEADQALAMLHRVRDARINVAQLDGFDEASMAGTPSSNAGPPELPVRTSDGDELPPLRVVGDATDKPKDRKRPAPRPPAVDPFKPSTTIDPDE